VSGLSKKRTFSEFKASKATNTNASVKKQEGIPVDVVEKAKKRVKLESAENRTGTRQAAIDAAQEKNLNKSQERTRNAVPLPSAGSVDVTKLRQMIAAHQAKLACEATAAAQK